MAESGRIIHDASPNFTLPEKSDKAREHLANERTFLAWIRTSISIIVFGFVVAKFGITLRQFLRLQGHVEQQGSLSLAIGTAFMALGVLLTMVSLDRYRVNLKRLETNQFRPARSIVMLVGLATAAFGAILVAYLLLTSSSL